jgi:hypothetical protein
MLSILRSVNLGPRPLGATLRATCPIGIAQILVFVGKLELCDWTDRHGPERLGTRDQTKGDFLLKLEHRPPPSTPASSAMLNLASRSSQAWRSVQRLAKGMASVSERIGDTKVSMSLLETGAYINYQRIEDNLVIVRDRYFSCFLSRIFSVSYCVLGSSVLSHFLKKSFMAISMTPTIRTLSAVLVT